MPTFTEMIRASQCGYRTPWLSAVEKVRGFQLEGASSGADVKHTAARDLPVDDDPGSPIAGMVSMKLIGSSSSESGALLTG